MANNEGNRFFSKHVGIVKYSDPAAVKAFLASTGDVYKSGSILVTCPEKGYTGTNLLYCRYGLSVPYYRVKEGDKLLIEPTIGATERWFYTGFVDCGRSEVSPETTDQMILLNDAGKFRITVGSIDIEIDGTTGIVKIGGGGEHFVKGDTLKTEIQKIIDQLTQLNNDISGWSPAPNDGGAALKTVLEMGFSVKPAADLSNILSTKIEGE